MAMRRSSEGRLPGLVLQAGIGAALFVHLGLVLGLVTRGVDVHPVGGVASYVLVSPVFSRWQAVLVAAFCVACLGRGWRVGVVVATCAWIPYSLLYDHLLYVAEDPTSWESLPTFGEWLRGSVLPLAGAAGAAVVSVEVLALLGPPLRRALLDAWAGAREH